MVVIRSDTRTAAAFLRGAGIGRRGVHWPERGAMRSNKGVHCGLERRLGGGSCGVRARFTDPERKNPDSEESTARTRARMRPNGGYVCLAVVSASIASEWSGARPGRDEARIRHRARLLEEANVRQLAVRAEQLAQRRLRARAVANVGDMQLCAG